jgi:hypothetical protein
MKKQGSNLIPFARPDGYSGISLTSLRHKAPGNPLGYTDRELHEMAQDLLRAGHGDHVALNLESWCAYFLGPHHVALTPAGPVSLDSETAQEQEPETAPAPELTPEEIAKTIARFPLPGYSSIIEGQILDRYASFKRAHFWPKWDHDERTSIFVGDCCYKTVWGPREQRPQFIEVFDGPGIKRVYVSADFDKRRIRRDAWCFLGAVSAEDLYSRLCLKAAEFNFRKLSGGMFPGKESAGLQEIEHQLEQISRSVTIKGKPKDRVVFTRLDAWKRQLISIGR